MQRKWSSIKTSKQGATKINNCSITCRYLQHPLKQSSSATWLKKIKRIKETTVNLLAQRNVLKWTTGRNCSTQIIVWDVAGRKEVNVSITMSFNASQNNTRELCFGNKLFEKLQDLHNFEAWNTNKMPRDRSS